MLPVCMFIRTYGLQHTKTRIAIFPTPALPGSGPPDNQDWVYSQPCTSGDLQQPPEKHPIKIYFYLR